MVPSSASRTSSMGMSAPVQSAVGNEERVEALRQYRILDTEPEPAFDRIVDLAAAFFEVPVAIINFVSDDRQWFKSTVGVEEEETGLEVSFCAYTVANEDLFVVEDLASDERFADNPYVDDGGMRFYAGAPLTTPGGHQIGTLCILDSTPQSVSPDALGHLSDLADMVVDELELRREHAERAAAAETLRRSQKLLQQTQTLAQVGGWTYDPQTDALSWTEETYRIHGLSPEADVDVEEALSFYTADAQPLLEERFRRLLETGEAYDLELPIVTRTGEKRWVRTLGEAHRENGEIVRVSGAVQDITEQRQTRKQLQTQKDLLQTIVDNIPIMVALFDEKGRFQLVNQAFEDRLGWEQDEVAGRSDAVEQFFSDPDDQQAAVDFVQEASGRWEEFEVRTKEGQMRDILGTSVALRDGRRIGIALDVSEKRAREERLRLLEAAIEHTRLPVLITEADPLEEPGPRIVYANPAFTDVTGYEQDDVQGRSPRFLQGDGTDRAALDRIREALENKEPVQEVVRNYTSDGTMYWNDIYIAPVFDEDGDATHYVSIQADVTDQMEQRRALREAKDAAEEADRVKSALLRNMNHEFRTPLTSIISFAKLVGNSPDLAEKFAPRILSGGQRLLRTLNAVMDFAELEREEVEVSPQMIDVRDIAWNVVAAFRERAERSGLTMKTDAPDGAVVARLDPHLVERVCTHLVSNAVKFTETGTIAVTVREHEDAVEVCVEDSGIGIPDADQSTVFDEFFQVSSGDDRTHEGNGIGLTIVKRMVNRMGGGIDLESAPGDGTRVTVTLPRDGSDAPS